MKTKTKYLVMAVEKTKKILVYGREIDMSLAWADRMCGVIPVFDTKKAAQKYAAKNFEILSVIVDERRCHDN